MFYRFGLTFVLMASLAILVANSKAANEKQRAYGQHLSAECTSCHRQDGASKGIPSILGWPPEKFIAALQSFKSGERTNPVMVSVAQSLDDEQMAALAVYFGSLNRPGATPGESR